jgi:hypothetical protein
MSVGGGGGKTYGGKSSRHRTSQRSSANGFVGRGDERFASAEDRITESGAVVADCG